MTVEESPARRQAVRLSRDANEIIGPLNGYHHEAYAFPLLADNVLNTLHGFSRGKLRVPRPGLFWFDRRCFKSEDLLLRALQSLPSRVSRVPAVTEDAEGFFLQGFVEGRTLGVVDERRGALSDRHLAQLEQLFTELASVRWQDLKRAGAERLCMRRDITKDGDSAQFLDRLINFTRDKVYRERGGHHAELFAALRFEEKPLDLLSDHLWAMERRSYCLLHGDLHGNNVIVDSADNLWFIDWELAMVGDPLYDLATHLHLMRYPDPEAKRVSSLWAEAVERGRKNSSNGWSKDLPLLLAYKAVQSVYTDVIRAVMRLGPRPDEARLVAETAEVQRAVALAWERLDRLSSLSVRAPFAPNGARRCPVVPSHEEVKDAFQWWFKTEAAAVALERSAD